MRIIPAPIMIEAVGTSRIPSVGTADSLIKADGWVTVGSHPSIPGSPPSIVIDVGVLKRRIGCAAAQKESYSENKRHADLS
jgi:hypothetical protein